MGLRFRLHLLLLLVTVTAFHFLLHLGSAIPGLAVPLAKVKAVALAASRRLAREKGFHPAVVLVFFAARSWPELCRSFSAADLSDSQIGLVTADLAIAFGLFAAAGPGLVVAAGSVVVAVVAVVCVAVSDRFASALASCSVCFVFSVCLVYCFAAAMGKGRSAVVFYFLVLRSSF